MKRKIRLTENELTDLVHRILESKNKHVCCKRCDWEWDITAEDEDPYLCHMCGHRNDDKEKNKMFENVNEQEEITHVSFSEEPFKHQYKLPRQYEILREKLINKEFTVTSDNLDITYKFVGISPGEKYNWIFYKPKEGEEYVSALVNIEKVLYKGQDVTEIVKLITNRGGQVRSIVKGSAYDRLYQLSKNLGLLVGQIATNI